MKDEFIMIHSEDFDELLLKMTDEEVGKTVKNMIRSFKGEEVEIFNERYLDVMTSKLCGRIIREKEISEKRSIYGALGGAKSKTKAKGKQKVSKTKANDKQIVSSNTNTNTNTNTIEILKYLNEKTGSHFGETKNNVQLITARLNDGYTVEDFKKVIDKKVKTWKSDSKMCKFLKPSTLFAPSHFDDYLNEPEERPKSNSFTEMRRADYNMSELEKRLIKN